MIDSNDELQVRNFNDKLKVLQNQILQKGYTEDNLKIVVSCNMFPENGIILPSGKEPYIYKNPECSLGIVVRDRIKKVDGISTYNDEQLATLKKQSEKYMPYNTKYVSVVYAAINGLYPDYFDTNFIIVDNFKRFADNKTILSMRPETTLFTGAIELSNDAVFLVKKSNYEEFSKKYPQLSKYKVVQYSGATVKALAMYLVSVDVVPEVMTLDYVKESPTSNMFLEFITNYANSRNVNLLSYDETEFYISDQEKTDKLRQMYDAVFYDFLLKKINIPENHFEELYRRLCEGDSYDPDNLIILDGIIESIGANNLVQIVTEYNNIIEQRIREGKQPANDKLLEIGKIELI